MELNEFMDRVGATDAEVAGEIDRDRTTVSRIRRGKVVPDAVTLLLLNRWATAVARRRRLRKSERLSWDHLLARLSTVA